MRLPIICTAALLIAATPAIADELTYGHGSVGIRTDEGIHVTCEILGTSGRTALLPGWYEVLNARAHHTPMPQKPLPGYCVNTWVHGDPEIVPVDPTWPINLGPLNRRIGVVCKINADKMGFACDWPPYTAYKEK